MIGSIPGIAQKGSQEENERKRISTTYIEEKYPGTTWNHVYTDGSAENATENGGGGIYLKLTGGREEKIAIATGKYSNNFRAESMAIKAAAERLMELKGEAGNYVVILTDALSVISALTGNRNEDLDELRVALSALSDNFERAVIQWIPSHCDISGNEEADRLAKEGGKLTQNDVQMSYSDVKVAIGNSFAGKWKREHPGHQKEDAYYRMGRKEQVTVFRLRTGHNRLRSHLFNKFKIGTTDVCPCGTGKMTAEHVLQDCPDHLEERKRIWTTGVPFETKLYGNVDDLTRTVTYFENINVDV